MQDYPQADPPLPTPTSGFFERFGSRAATPPPPSGKSAPSSPSAASTPVRATSTAAVADAGSTPRSAAGEGAEEAKDDAEAEDAEGGGAVGDASCRSPEPQASAGGVESISDTALLAGSTPAPPNRENST